MSSDRKRQVISRGMCRMPALYSLNATQNQKRTLNKSMRVEKFNASETGGAMVPIAGVSRLSEE